MHTLDGMRAIGVFVLIGSIAVTSCGDRPGDENLEIHVLRTSCELRGESYRSQKDQINLSRLLRVQESRQLVLAVDLGR